jgi:c-di-AMP phosphodiesterase-like protein
MKLSKESFAKLCTPAKIYFSLAILSIILGLFNGFHLIMIVIKLIFAFIWTYGLSWLCKKGFKALSWFLVLLPFIMMFLVLFGIMRDIKQVHYLNPLSNKASSSISKSVSM